MRSRAGVFWYSLGLTLLLLIPLIHQAAPGSASSDPVCRHGPVDIKDPALKSHEEVKRYVTHRTLIVPVRELLCILRAEKQGGGGYVNGP